jgi:hypothetical protein
MSSIAGRALFGCILWWPEQLPACGPQTVFPNVSQRVTGRTKASPLSGSCSRGNRLHDAVMFRE